MADDRLSRAASRVWNIERYAHMDYEMDGSGDCGPMIAKSHQKAKLRALAELGYTAEAYNAELRRRFCGDEYPHMSFNVYHWLLMLEVEPAAEWLANHTSVYTGAGEYSTLAYLGVTPEVPDEWKFEVAR